MDPERWARLEREFHELSEAEADRRLARLAELDEEGRLIGGRIESAIQLRPGGPVPDASRSAFRLMRQLSEEDFPVSSPVFMEDGSIQPRFVFKEEISKEYTE